MTWTTDPKWEILEDDILLGETEVSKFLKERDLSRIGGMTSNEKHLCDVQE